MDLTKELFDAVEDVQTFTLQPSQLAVVIASYDKTIGKIHVIFDNSVHSQTQELYSIINITAWQYCSIAFI